MRETSARAIRGNRAGIGISKTPTAPRAWETGNEPLADTVSAASPSKLGLWLQTFSDVGSANRPFADDLPLRLGNIDRRRPGPADRTAIEDQVDTTVHRTENLDTASAGWLPRPVGAGGDDRHLQKVDQAVGNSRTGTADGQPPGVPCDLKRQLRSSRNDDCQRPGPKMAGQQIKTRGQGRGVVLRHLERIHQDGK